MKIPSLQTIHASAVAYLREMGSTDAADLLARCTVEIGDKAQGYSNTTELGLNITLRCRASDLAFFEGGDGYFDDHSEAYHQIWKALQSTLPAQAKVHSLSPRSVLVDRKEFEKGELERLIEAQKDLMIAVATGGPRIQEKNQEYRQRRESIAAKLRELHREDPNPFSDLWAWHGRWSSGDLPTYRSRRDYIRELYTPLLEELAGAPSRNPAAPTVAPTGWIKVDRVVDRIVQGLATAQKEEEFQTLGLLCRECLISLGEAVYDPAKHQSPDGVVPSKTDAVRMLGSYFAAEYAGSANEALRKHAKAALDLAVALQHKRTATLRDAALCAEATRTVVNIVAITSGKR